MDVVKVVRVNDTHLLSLMYLYVFYNTRTWLTILSQNFGFISLSANGKQLESEHK